LEEQGPTATIVTCLSSRVRVWTGHNDALLLPVNSTGLKAKIVCRALCTSLTAAVASNWFTVFHWKTLSTTRPVKTERPIAIAAAPPLDLRLQGWGVGVVFARSGCSN
jgi:hypothetical protein